MSFLSFSFKERYFLKSKNWYDIAKPSIFALFGNCRSSHKKILHLKTFFESNFGRDTKYSSDIANIPLLMFLYFV